MILADKLKDRDGIDDDESIEKEEVYRMILDCCLSSLDHEQYGQLCSEIEHVLLGKV